MFDAKEWHGLRQCLWRGCGQGWRRQISQKEWSGCLCHPCKLPCKSQTLIPVLWESACLPHGC